MNKDFLNEQALEFIKKEQNLFFSNYAGAEGIIWKLLTTGECITTINIGHQNPDCCGGIFNFVGCELYSGGIDLHRWYWKHSVEIYQPFIDWLEFQKSALEDEFLLLESRIEDYHDLIEYIVEIEVK